ncbi:MAG: hypothetical protein ACRC6M_02390 [Microcystaceae cyanobacterium]
MPTPEWESFVSDFDDEQPSVVRSRRNYEATLTLADSLRSIRIELDQLKADFARNDALFEASHQRLQRIDQTVHSGTNCLSTRVALLERQDKQFEQICNQDKSELEHLRGLARFIKSYPFGLKGFIMSVVIATVFVATITDISVRGYVYKRLETQLMEPK